jgi:oligopeptide/dipeptide ABC transporter ATP-binding protein
MMPKRATGWALSLIRAGGAEGREHVRSFGVTNVDHPRRRIVRGIDPRRRTKEAPLSGDPPNPINPPSGCCFRTRCQFAEAVCAADPDSPVRGMGRRAITGGQVPQ